VQPGMLSPSASKSAKLIPSVQSRCHTVKVWPPLATQLGGLLVPVTDLLACVDPPRPSLTRTVQVYAVKPGTLHTAVPPDPPAQPDQA